MILIIRISQYELSIYRNKYPFPTCDRPKPVFKIFGHDFIFKKIRPTSPGKTPRAMLRSLGYKRPEQEIADELNQSSRTIYAVLDGRYKHKEFRHYIASKLGKSEREVFDHIDKVEASRAAGDERLRRYYLSLKQNRA